MATRFAYGGTRRPASAWLALRAAPVFHNELDALSVPSYFVSTRAHAADSDETFGPRAPRGSSHIARCRSPSMCSFIDGRGALGHILTTQADRQTKYGFPPDWFTMIPGVANHTLKRFEAPARFQYSGAQHRPTNCIDS